VSNDVKDNVDEETVPAVIAEQVMAEAARLSVHDSTLPTAIGVIQYLRRARANVSRLRQWEMRTQP
jgi:hypothetical protein